MSLFLTHCFETEAFPSNKVTRYKSDFSEIMILQAVAVFDDTDIQSITGCEYTPPPS